MHPSCIAAPSEWRKYFCEVDGRNDGILQTQLLRSLGCVSLDSSEVARIPRVPSHRARVQRCSEHLPEREGGRSQLLSGPPSRSALRSPTGRTDERTSGGASDVGVIKRVGRCRRWITPNALALFLFPMTFNSHPKVGVRTITRSMNKVTLVSGLVHLDLRHNDHSRTFLMCQIMNCN